MPTFVFDRSMTTGDVWKPSQTIKKVLDNLSTTIENKFPNQVNYIIDTTWIEFKISELRGEYNRIGKIDNIFLCSTVDHAHTCNIPIPDNPNLKVYQVGNTKDQEFEKYRFDFWAITVNDLFKTYTENELRLVDFDNLKYFLCYQNKPHTHRQLFSHKILNLEIFNKGILTLQKYRDTDFLYSNIQVMSLAENIDTSCFMNPDQTLLPPTEIDKSIPYSLGDLTIWKQCFLNVISETLNNDDSDFFITEKVWKPILGMRPFIINGKSEILNYLDKHNFYTFDEYWPDVDFRSCKTQEDTVDCCVRVVNTLCSLSQKEIKLMYLNMYPKLVHNRKRFYQFAKEQELKTTTLFDGIKHDINN